jgi:hypothetical protein
MSDRETGGSAFPYSALAPGGPTIYADSHGMTLRDYLAGQALAVIPGDVADPVDLAKDAYRIADAMLAERQK